MLKERLRASEADILRQEKRCNAAERAREQSEAEKQADLEAMSNRIEAQRSRAVV